MSQAAAERGPAVLDVPASPSAERAVLGAVLVDAGCFERIGPIIGAEDFYSLAHQRIFEACARLASASTPIDSVTVPDQLKRDGVLVDVGGAGYVSSLADDLPDPANVEHYAKIVREHAAKRRALELGQQIITAASSDNGDAPAVFARVAEALARLQAARLGSAELFEQSVAREALNVKVRAEARRRIAAECAGALGEAPLTPLPDFLAVADPLQRYRLEELWPVGGRVIFAAAYKAGKTTARDNLVRSLADEEPFLGRFAVHAPEGRVVIVDTELDPRMLRRWLRDQRIRNAERVAVLSLRGRLSTFDLLDKDTRARWADRLRAIGASIVILDCLRSALDALGLSEDKDAGRFLVAFDELLAEAGASEAVVIHHAGHGMERSRGDSRLRDWPDAEWRLVREKPEDGAEPEADARRFFTAFGRDVDVPEGLLEYNQQARRLTFAGGTRKAVRAQRRTDELVAGVIEAVTREPGATTRQLDALLREVGLAHQRGDAGRAARTAEAAGRIVRVPGPRGSFLHYLAGQENDRSRPFPTIPAGNAGAVVRPFPTAPIGSGERSTTPQPVGTPPFPPGTLEPTHLDANREPGDDDEPLPGEAEV